MNTQTTVKTRDVLLPRTPFAAHLSSKKTDEPTLLRWEEDGLANRVHASCAGKPQFVLHDGPPYANGDVHMGHALNKTLKDMVVRSRRMMGEDAVLVPGWDCHGLPVEWKVEEQFRQAGREKGSVPVMEFREACRSYAEKWVGRQAAGFRRLGVTADFARAYKTMDKEADAATVTALQAFLRNGRLNRALRPVLWSVPEQTALADAEVEYKEERYTSLMVRFPVRSSKHAALRGASLVCWTTTPWTLPGNRAVACAPQCSYSLCKVTAVSSGTHLVVGEHVVLAESLAGNVLTKAGAEAWEVVDTFNGTDLQETVCNHPLHQLGYGHAVPVLAAEFVETSNGTGFVHVAPALGPVDFELGAAEGLDVELTVGADGRYLPHLPFFAGEVVMKENGERGDADALVLAALLAQGALFSSWRSKHETAHSWRSKSPLLYRSTPQWFVSMPDEQRAAAVSALKDVEFLPEASRVRLTSMTLSRPEWCVSRQRMWGVPLGLFVNRHDGSVLADEAVLERVREAFSAEGSDAWYSSPPSRFLGSDYDPEDWEQSMDVLDVWFESGATYSWVLPSRYGTTKADLYLEGSDQHRGWFQSSLFQSMSSQSSAPCRALMTHGFVLDKKGRKMSKSEGNVVDPLEVTQRVGVDTLRLWVASSDMARDAKYSDEAMRGHADTLRRFRNTLRWLLGNMASAQSSPVAYENLEKPEKWMLAKLNQMGRSMREQYAAYDFPKVVGLLNHFCAHDLSSVWFDMRKDALYCDSPSSLRRMGVVTVLSEVFRHLVSWLAPLVPFTADEAWHFASLPGSVHEREWPSLCPQWENEKLLCEWNHVLTVRASVKTACERLQADGTIGALLEADVYSDVPPDYSAALSDVSMADVCGVSSVTLRFAAETREVGSAARPAQGEKCARCWRVLPEVEGRGVCFRCSEV